MLQIKAPVIIGLFSVFFVCAVYGQEKPFNSRFWTGHELRASLGYITSDTMVGPGKNKPGKIRLIGHAAFFYGYEYGWQFADHWFTSLGLEWIIAYPRNFPSRDPGPLFRTLAWVQPMTHVRIGYVFNNYALLTLGLTYLWALSLDFRIPLGEHLYFETQYVQWLDKFINVKAISPTLGAGFDLFNFSMGIGWKF